MEKRRVNLMITDEAYWRLLDLAQGQRDLGATMSRLIMGHREERKESAAPEPLPFNGRQRVYTARYSLDF